jgi:hypothetical protein
MELTSITCLLLNLFNTNPASGMVIISPVGKAASTVPNWASLSFNCLCNAGIRAAHAAKLKPEIKKKMLTANRLENGET